MDDFLEGDEKRWGFALICGGGIDTISDLITSVIFARKYSNSVDLKYANDFVISKRI